MRGAIRSPLVVLMLTAAALGPARPAAAAEFVVTLPDDPAPGAACLQGGDCSLREAVLANDPAAAGADTVRLPAGTFTLTRVGANNDTGATGDLDVTQELTIVGAGADSTVIDASALGDRGLHVLGARLTLQGLTLTGGGRFQGGGIVDRGGNVLVAGAGGSLTTDNVVVRGGAANYGAGIAFAGAADQSLTMTGTVLDGNAAVVDGGGLFAEASNLPVTVSGGALTANSAGRDGGGAWLQGFHTVTADDWEVSGNRADRAGGLGLLGGGNLATLTNLTVRGNDATDAANGYGAGIWANGTIVDLGTSVVEENTAARTGGGVFVTNAALTVVDSALSANAATESGGGVATETTSDVRLERVLVDDNQAGDGGGVFGAIGPVTLVNTTVAGNRAATGAGGVAGTADFFLEHATVAGNASTNGTAGNLGVGDTATLTGSVVANPGADDVNCVLAAGATVTGAGSVEDAATCGIDPATNLVGVDAQLEPLRDNGGPTRARAPAPASPALDAAGATCPGVDQRGLPRPQDGDSDGDAACDAGAVEVQPSADLEVSMADGPDPVGVGQLLTYRIVVANAGPQAAPGTTLTVTLPASVTLGPLGDCTAAGVVVTCPLGTVAAGGEGSVALTVTPQQPGTLEAVATATSGVPDPTPATVTTSTTAVEGTPPPPDDTPPPSPPPGGAPSVVRLAGPGRIETAVEVSRSAFADGQAGAVVLARADLVPDALAGAPLAATLDAPLLLTASDALSPATQTELQRVLPAGGIVTLLGGPVALEAAVEQQVTALGFTPRRLGGANRFGTAVVIATDGLTDPETLLLADGGGFPDALAAGTAASASGGAVLLSGGAELPPETRAYLDGPGAPTTRYAVGGPAAAALPGATALVGATRVDTALTVARQFFPAPAVVGVATGGAFPDALAGGPHVGSLGGPLLLSENEALPEVVAAYLGEVRTTARTAYLYGGEQALAPAVEAAVLAALS